MPDNRNFNRTSYSREKRNVSSSACKKFRASSFISSFSFPKDRLLAIPRTHRSASINARKYFKVYILPQILFLCLLNLAHSFKRWIDSIEIIFLFCLFILYVSVEFILG